MALGLALRDAIDHNPLLFIESLSPVTGFAFLYINSKRSSRTPVKPAPKRPTGWDIIPNPPPKKTNDAVSTKNQPAP
jgi:hypothetical protein